VDKHKDDKEMDQRQPWQAPQLKVVGVNEQTLASFGVMNDGITFDTLSIRDLNSRVSTATCGG
jgi:hypothetical protein